MDLGSLLNPLPEASTSTSTSAFAFDGVARDDDYDYAARAPAHAGGARQAPSASSPSASASSSAPSASGLGNRRRGSSPIVVVDRSSNNSRTNSAAAPRTNPPIPAFLLANQRDRSSSAASSGRLPTVAAADAPSSRRRSLSPPPAPAPTPSVSLHRAAVAQQPPLPPTHFGGLAVVAPPPPLPDELLRTTILWRAFSDQLDSIKAESGTDESLEVYSAQHVSWVFNFKEINYRNQLWSDWTIFATLWEKLGVRAFPVSERKVTLLVSQFVDLPCSASLRQAYGSVSTAHDVNLHRAESMLNTLKLAGQATEHLWPRVPSFNEADPDRFETLREVWQRIPWFKIPKKARIKTSGVKRERIDEPLRGSAGAPRAHGRPEDFPMYSEEEGGLGLISFSRLISDLPMVAQDLRVLQPEPTLAHLGHGRLHTALIHEGTSQTEFRFSIRRIWTLYSDLSSKFTFPEFPITPIKLALFAFAFTPGPIRAAFDQVSDYSHMRHYAAFEDANSFVTALETMESLQRLTRGHGEINAYEADQWVLWRRAFLEDLLIVKKKPSAKTETASNGGAWGESASSAQSSHANGHSSGSSSKASHSGSNGRSAPSSSTSTSSTSKHARPRLPSAAPLLPKSATTSAPQSPKQIPMKRNRSASGTSDNWSDHSELPGSSAMTVNGSGSGTPRATGRRPGRPRKQRIRTPTPPPQPWQPEKVGELPEDRRPPPLPPVFGSPFGGMFAGESAEAMMARSVALHRPKRNLAFKMVPLANLEVLT